MEVHVQRYGLAVPEACSWIDKIQIPTTILHSPTGDTVIRIILLSIVTTYNKRA